MSDATDRNDDTGEPTAGATGGPTDDQPPPRPTVRALAVVIALVGVAGFAALFGTAVGAVWLAAETFVVAAGSPLADRLWFLGLLAVPAAAFLFVTLAADADLERPTWPEGHPPLVDAWLLAFSAAGTVTVAVATPNWPGVIVLAGVAAGLLAAYLLAPLWLARRCLARPRWGPGVATIVAAPLVVAVAGFAVAAPVVEGEAGGIAGGLTLLMGGTLLPFGAASVSPGPRPLARALAVELSRTGGRIRRGVRWLAVWR